jgi:hypothetical protein
MDVFHDTLTSNNRPATRMAYRLRQPDGNPIANCNRADSFTENCDGVTSMYVPRVRLEAVLAAGESPDAGPGGATIQRATVRLSQRGACETPPNNTSPTRPTPIINIFFYWGADSAICRADVPAYFSTECPNGQRCHATVVSRDHPNTITPLKHQAVQVDGGAVVECAPVDGGLYECTNLGSGNWLFTSGPELPRINADGGPVFLETSEYVRWNVRSELLPDAGP